MIFAGEHARGRQAGRQTFTDREVMLPLFVSSFHKEVTDFATGLRKQVAVPETNFDATSYGMHETGMTHTGLNENVRKIRQLQHDPSCSRGSSGEVI